MGAMGFAASLVASIGEEGLNISNDHTSVSSKVGALIFVCEYLMGMPIVTATALYVDSKQASDVFRAGPCLKTSSCSTKMTVYKDVYYFVTPTMIHLYAGELDSIIGDGEYGEFVSFLRSLIEGKAYISKITDKDGNEVSSLATGKEYHLLGSCFGSNGILRLKQGGEGKGNLSTSGWTDSDITFTVPTGTADGEYTLTLLDGSTSEGGDELVSYNVTVSGSSSGA